jgi:hypothetical protein
MRRIKVILAVVAAVATTMVVAAPAMAQTVFGAIGGISLGGQLFRRRWVYRQRWSVL